jgi:hypothetical protein
MATSPRTTRDPARSPGAYTAGEGRGSRKRRAWLGWLLGLLALVLLGLLLIAVLSGDEDGGAGTAGGSLTAGDQSLLPVPSGGLSGDETDTATGRQVTVQSVVKDEGFWVGTSQSDRVYVEYGGDVGANENQGFEPAVGDKVNLTGEMRPAPEDPARTLNLGDQDAQQVSRQGAYINAAEVSR